MAKAEPSVEKLVGHDKSAESCARQKCSAVISTTSTTPSRSQTNADRSTRVRARNPRPCLQAPNAKTRSERAAKEDSRYCDDAARGQDCNPCYGLPK
jgi:hypothetical protein